MKYFYLLLIPFSLLADNIKESRLAEILMKKDKAVLESELHEDAWIAPLMIQAEYYKSNVTDQDDDEATSIGVSWSQDIYRSGAIGYEQEQAKLENSIAHKVLRTEFQAMNITVYEYVLILGIMDLKLKQLTLSIRNKEIEIEAKQARYNKGLIDISELDTSMLELSNLKNEVERTELEKLSYLKDLKMLTNKKYKEIKLEEIALITLDEFLSKNSVHIQNDEVEHKRLNQKIIHASYLPKVSVLANYKYENSKYRRNIRNDKTNWDYGLSVSIPIDYNERKNKEIAQKDLLLSQTKYQNRLEEEEMFYNTVRQEVRLLQNRIANHEEAIDAYNRLIDEVNELYVNGLKTEEDLITLRNTKASKLQDVLIDKINVKLSYLKLMKRIY